MEEVVYHQHQTLEGKEAEGQYMVSTGRHEKKVKFCSEEEGLACKC